jgi:kumamolisin
VLAVGGTSLPFEESYALGSESAWSCANQDFCEGNGNFGNTLPGGSGGGTATQYTRPAYQTGQGDFGNGRNVPDVSLLANPNLTAYDVRFNGADYGVGGTSLSSPVWAGILSVYRQYRGTPPPNGHTLWTAGPTEFYAVWHLSSAATPDFHDITAGTNAVYACGVGYDRVTGIGSPDAMTMFIDLKNMNG